MNRALNRAIPSLLVIGLGFAVSATELSAQTTSPLPGSTGGLLEPPPAASEVGRGTGEEMPSAKPSPANPPSPAGGQVVQPSRPPAASAALADDADSTGNGRSSPSAPDTPAVPAAPAPDDGLGRMEQPAIPPPAPLLHLPELPPPPPDPRSTTASSPIQPSAQGRAGTKGNAWVAPGAQGARGDLVRETAYGWEPRWHGRWNPFVRKHLAYHLLPRTRWVPKTQARVDTAASTARGVPPVRPLVIPQAAREQSFVAQAPPRWRRPPTPDNRSGSLGPLEDSLRPNTGWRNRNTFQR